VFPLLLRSATLVFGCAPARARSRLRARFALALDRTWGQWFALLGRWRFASPPE
jgi:hypothetical protein